MKHTLLLAILLLGMLLSCTPKVAEQTAAPPPPKPTEVGPCGTFDNSPNGEEALNSHVIYRDYLKAGNYEEAFGYWKKAYKLAPAADGRRNTHYADGIRFHEYFLTQTEDAVLKKEHTDKIFELYDQIEECYGEVGYVSGRKAFDLYYKYKDRATRDEIYDLFTKSIDTDKDSAQLFILNPFTDLLVRRYFDGEIDMAEAQKYDALIRRRLHLGLKSGEYKEQWAIINEYVPKRLEAFEGVKGFYGCDYYLDKYWQDFLEDSTNCEIIGQVYGKLRRGGCDTTSLELTTLVAAGRRHCIIETGPSEQSLAYNALREGNYEEAVRRFQDLVNNTDDIDRKATFLLLMAKVYYRDLKNFPEARKYALEAASIKKNWGEPFLLIGRLYASSGPLCGPGRGWDSQIVVWPAIDKWNHAKRIDPTAAAEANKWIGTYAKYMPDFSDIFQRSLKEGASFRVGCWIQENTTIRAAKE